METVQVSRIIATSSPDKVRLEIRQSIDRGGRMLDPIYLANQDDERFNQPSTTVGWLPFDVRTLAKANKDLHDELSRLESNPDGQVNRFDFIEVGLVDPVFNFNGIKAHLSLRIIETTDPNEYDSKHPKRAKRMGSDGDWLVDDQGKLIFSYVQVGFVYPSEHKAIYAGQGMPRQAFTISGSTAPEDRHQLIQYESTVSDPMQAIPATSYSGNIVEDAVAEEQEQGEGVKVDA